MIAGYACVKFIITQKIGGGEGSDLYTVWATDKIKPALPLYAHIKATQKDIARIYHAGDETSHGSRFAELFVDEYIEGGAWF